MSRGIQNLRQGDVTKAIKGAIKGGMIVKRVEIDKAGSIILSIGETESMPADDLDRELAEFEARNGQG
jgi:hypothetical protein